MTLPATPSSTPRLPRQTPEPPLNPLRYHAMVNPAHIPEPSPPRRSRRRWPAVAALGAAAVLLAAVVAAGSVMTGLVGG
ncbi:ferric-dicitrate binding protein FerR (iron transport regulator) [Okibacterium sp. HSC-33S16]|uniref:hypothetical protein n=1 Tax=Okibacterium sp. HSC-33S16 TaxID=2910965 RepID=UPI00209FF8EC|nr:hypothetical protein [Okibacterium sp. HSC-33S16]MCP2031375.1 ferric-dicitrate binding protein FerR (iron transport regulator) [Okibacterium sp. HSC-33S16]